MDALELDFCHLTISGPRGLGFESRYSDHRKALEMYVSSAFSYFFAMLGNQGDIAAILDNADVLML